MRIPIPFLRLDTSATDFSLGRGIDAWQCAVSSGIGCFQKIEDEEDSSWGILGAGDRVYA